MFWHLIKVQQSFIGPPTFVGTDTFLKGTNSEGATRKYSYYGAGTLKTMTRQKVGLKQPLGAISTNKTFLCVPSTLPGILGDLEATLF